MVDGERFSGHYLRGAFRIELAFTIRPELVAQLSVSHKTHNRIRQGPLVVRRYQVTSPTMVDQVRQPPYSRSNHRLPEGIGDRYHTTLRSLEVWQYHHTRPLE